MNAPHPHHGFVTIDAQQTILCHDTMDDAAFWAATHEGTNVYDAHFTPTFDMQAVRERVRLARTA